MSMRRRSVDFAGLLAFLAVCLGIGVLGSWITAGSVNSWYPTLNKPSFNPPNWVFAPVWTTLYVLMAIAAWRIWRSASWPAAWPALLLFAVQLVVNLGWSFTFFGLRSLGGAVAVILVLDASVAATLYVFGRRDRLAGWLLGPYLLWILFATMLTVSLWRLN
ncbi:MAG: tryptophan-rich sensory protein [Proteobacteria bacterium]|nr:tryptophan-rich sensory protein [Pseudomonadota bacterium]